MIRAVIVVIALLGIFLVGEWTRQLREENDKLKKQKQELEATLAQDRKNYERLYYEYIREENLLHHGNDSKSQAIKQVEEQLLAARKHLEALMKGLEALKATATPSTTADSHIADDNGQIASLQTHLQQLDRDGSVVQNRSKEFRREQDHRRQAALADLGSRAQSVSVLLREVRAQIRAVQQSKDPNKQARLSELNAQAGDLTSQQADINKQRAVIAAGGKHVDHEINEEVNGEQGEIHYERDQVLRQLNQLKADVDYWKKLKTTPGGQDKQIKDLQGEINVQRLKVSTLESLMK